MSSVTLVTLTNLLLCAGHYAKRISYLVSDQPRRQISLVNYYTRNEEGRTGLREVQKLAWGHTASEEPRTETQTDGLMSESRLLAAASSRVDQRRSDVSRPTYKCNV